MKKQTIMDITESTLSKIKRDFRELIQHYPFSQMILVDKKEIHFEVYAINKKEIDQLRIKKHKISNDKYSRRLYIIIRNNYRDSGPIIYSMEKWKSLNLIPYESKHFYDKKELKYENGTFKIDTPGFSAGKGYLTCTSVSIANKNMGNPLLENVKSAEMMLISYELFLRGINKTIVLRQYSHGDEGVEQYVREQRRKK